MKIGHLSVASLHVLADFGFQGAVIRNLHNLPLEESAVGYSPRLKKAAEALRTAPRDGARRPLAEPDARPPCAGKGGAGEGAYGAVFG